MMKRRLFILPVVCCVLMCQYASAQIQADFSANTTSGCGATLVRFQDLSTGNPTSWKWETGLSSDPLSQQNPSVVYINPGTYTVKLTVYKGADSSVRVKTAYITIYANPTVNFNATPLIGCFPLTVAFNDLSLPGSGNISSWQWDFGDGSIANTRNPSHTYLNVGTFNVTLTVKNSFGCVNTLNRPNLINVYTGVKAGFDNSSPPVCVLPVTVNFTNTSTGPVGSYLWNFGDGQTSTAANPSHIYTTAGLYTVRLIVTSINGCTDTITKTNGIRAGLVDADFNAPASICTNTNFTLQNTSTPLNALVSTTWDFGDGTSSTSTNPVKSYTAPGIYTIKLVSDFGLCQDSSSKTITVEQKPTANFSGLNLNSCRPPLTATFTSTTTGATSIIWNFGDGTTSNSLNPSHTYTTTGSFTVTLIAQNASGCRDTLRRPGYVVLAPPSINRIDSMPMQGCVPYTANFSPIVLPGEPIVSYEWNFGDGTTGTGQNPSHTYTIEGVYTIKLKVTTSSGCSDSISYTAGVTVGQKPAPAFVATPRVACASVGIHFTDLTPAPLPDRWLWLFGDGTTSTQQNPEHLFSDTGYFSVTLIATHNGCKDTIRIPNYVYIKPPVARFLDSFDCSNQKLHFFKNISVGALTNEWNFGDSSTSTAISPSHLYADTGKYIIRLKVTNDECENAQPRTILVLNEKAGFTIGDSLGCKSSVKEFTATSHPWNIKSYAWDFGDNRSSTVGPFVRHYFDSAGVYNVKLKITDLNNCTDTISQLVAVTKFGPNARFGPFQKVCVQQPVTFTDLSTAGPINPIVQWIWDFGDNTGPQTFTAPPFTHTYTTRGLYNVRLIVSDISGCPDTLLKQNIVQVNAPSANFVSTDTLVCASTTVRLSDASLGSVITRFWNFGDGTTASGANVQHSYIAEGSYTIGLKVTDEIGCVDSIVKPQFINVYNARARFIMSDSFTSCPPLFMTFTNQSINAAQSKWDFGDGNTSSLYNPSHTYTQSGTFLAKLIVTGNGGCTDSTTRQIVVLGPIGSFTYTPILGCTPLQVNFTTSTQGTSIYTFDFSDGNTQSGSNSGTIHSYVSLGNYVPRLILEDSLGCKLPILGTDTIRVKGIRTFIKSLPTYLVCDSATIQFRDSITTNDIIQSYEWNFGDGTTSNLQAPSHSYSVNGFYTVSLKATTVTGCVSSDTLKIPIHVTTAPQVSVMGSIAGCVPTIVQFTGQWLNPDTSHVAWNWNFGNGQFASTQNPSSLTYNTPGNYTITLIGRNASGCADTFIHPLTVYALPNVNAGPDKFVCRDQTAVLNATGATSYLWNAHPSLSCINCPSPGATPDSNQVYVVQGTDDHTCKNVDTVFVRVKQRFVMRVDPGDTLCINQTFQMNAYGAENYIWSPSRFLNSATISNPVTRPDSTVLYRVIGYDSVGCFRDTGYVPIQLYQMPKVDIIENLITLQVGDPVQLHSITSPDVTRWRWSPNLNLTCFDCPDPIANPRQNLTYTLTVTNDGECTAQDRVTITLLCKEANIFVPNTFSPNKDGANDMFYPRGKGLFSIKSMHVYNRWGELVFEKNNFTPNDPSAGWDGTHKGISLTSDVYVYVMEIICDSNVLYTVKGNVTLLR